jgi:ubiquinone/menaquinone biosynthesis C-methylase UbiE
VDRVGLHASDRVLDAACGTGVVARVAAERVGDGRRVVGVDVNSAMVEVARARLPQLEWREASVSELPFADDEFDVVCCQLGLQFVPDRPAALSETRRVLAPGGRFGASVYSSIKLRRTHSQVRWIGTSAKARHVRSGSSRRRRWRRCWRGARRRSVNDWSRAWAFPQEVHIAVTTANRSE